MIFGSNRDFNLLLGIQRELVHDVIEQEIIYRKLSLEDIHANIYGEALEKIYLSPVKLNCMITRGDQVVDISEFGPDLGRTASFAMIRRDLQDVSILPEVGDIVQWQNDFYEVDTVRENSLFLGRDNNYNLTSYGSSYGGSLSIILDTHLTRADRVGISEVR